MFIDFTGVFVMSTDPGVFGQWQAMLPADQMPHRVLIWDGKRTQSAEYTLYDGFWVYGRGTKKWLAKHQPLFWMPLPDDPPETAAQREKREAIEQRIAKQRAKYDLK